MKKKYQNTTVNLFKSDVSKTLFWKNPKKSSIKKITRKSSRESKDNI